MLILGAIIPMWQMGLAVVLVMVCVGALAWAVAARRDPAESQVSRRLSSAGLGSAGQTAVGRSPASDLLRTSSTLADRLSLLSKPLEMKTDLERNKLARRMAQAGIRNSGAIPLFLASKMTLLMVGGGLGLAYGWSQQMAAVDLFSWVTIFAMAGFLLPNFWLSMMAKKRSEKITNALPDSLDMLVIAVEAGLALDAAIQRVGDEMQRTFPELSEEWRIAARETQMGIPRSEAMLKMAERAGVPDMKTLVAVLTQAERFGTSIAQTLRVHAETARIKRRQKAEERAAQTTVKLLFPLLFFLFPVIFIVIMGPAAINVMESGFMGN